MNYIGKVLSNFKDVYNEINGATLTGAIDAVVVRQEDGSYISSPFHVRFGKIGVLRSKEKVVDIEINGNPVDIRMKLGDTGEAFFVEEIAEDDEISSHLGTSPLPNSFFSDFNDIIRKEDDVKSMDSGVEAEEAATSKSIPDEESSISKSLVTKNNLDTLDNFDIATEQSTIVEETIQNAPSTETVTLKVEVTETANNLLEVSHSTSMKVHDTLQQEALVRSKSLTTEAELLQVIKDGQGSKTDNEEHAKFPIRHTRRRRKKRALSKKRRMKAAESQSSDNSTTSETADLSSLIVTEPRGSHDTIFLMEDVETPAAGLNAVISRTGSAFSTLPKATKAKSFSGHRTLGPDFHPFSDTDISPPPSPGKSRSESPVKSDTEYEYEKQKCVSGEDDHSNDNKWSWTWGELPTPPQYSRSNSASRKAYDLPPSENTDKKDINSTQATQDAQRSMLGSMFSFMRATKKARHFPESDGIYLDDLSKLDEIDPEVAALYFPRNSILYKDSYTGFRSVAKDEDVESGNGTSLPQSPHSVEGAIGGLKISDSDFEDIACRHRHVMGDRDLAFSLCGALHDNMDGAFPESLFLQSLVTYDDFCEKPDLLYNPNLVVRLDGKFMNWATAAPQVMSLVLFQRPLPSKVVASIEVDNLPKKEMRKRTASKGYSWFSWGRNNQVTTDTEKLGENNETNMSSEHQLAIMGTSSENISLEISASATSGVTEGGYLEYKEEVCVSGTATVVQEPLVTGEAKKRVRTDSSGSEADEDANPGRYKKSLRLSNEQIKKLNLRNGSNEVVFSVTTAYQGTSRCKSHIFLWNYDEKIIVSDIDGTITKSDVLGQILPIIGKDWAQGGVAQLFTKIKNNGYNFLYLSARAIGQARITRDYLRSIKQGDLSLPDGPLLLNPTSLIQAFHREVIEKKPEEFKISCLRDIKALFPGSRNPFYAGYGNKINDVYAYRAVGIPISRIFTINHRGELKHELTQAFQTTYTGQLKLVDETFPPIHRKMVSRDLLSFMYSESEEDEEGVIDFDYDSDWEGFPTGMDAMSFGSY